LKEGTSNRVLIDITRVSWDNPIPEVILYSLYKFAEACGDYYQFSLETLLDDSIERDGVSPTRIFGLDRDTMVRILNGLSINYPEFISASFTLDLDNITLRNDKTAEDVLQLL
jgi:phosphoadenosine phosphosulfate reductase